MASSLHEAPASATRQFAEDLRQRSDTALVALLRARGDLAVPAPATLRSLAARASSHTSLERALAQVDALVLQVVEAVTALGRFPREDVPHALGAAVPDSALPSAAARRQIDDAVEAAVTAALLWDDGGALHPSPGLDEVFGHYPAGLGPVRGETTDTDRPLTDRLRATPPEQRAVLEALAWGPPVGRVPPSGTRQREAVDELVGHGLLARADAQHVLLTREVGLALRGGRTHRAPALRPEPTGRAVPAETVAAESASAALELVRRVSVLRSAWSDDPPRVLRSGGLGVRDLRRLAARLECDEEAAAFVAELAAEAGLIRDDGEVDPSFVPLDVAWSELDDADRWAVLARAWVSSHRTPWRVGTRDEGGALRSALSPDLERGWAPRLRAAVLRVLGSSGNALPPDDVVAVLTWEAPRNAPPSTAVRGLLAEASWLGLTGAGAMSPPGRALLADVPDEPIADALRGVLPPEVGEILLQGDLTGVVPGRPSRELASLVEIAADTESRGAATTVRFSAASVTRALDRGRSADDLLAALARHSPVPVPQPLEYLVRDTARRHGAVRVGVASSYLRAADEVTLAGLEHDPALAHLRLVRLAPTVLVSSAPPALLHETLRERGVVSALEGPDGRVLDVRHRRPEDPRGPRPPAARPARTIAHGARGGTDAGPPVRSQPDLSALVAGLRAADDDAHASEPDTARPGDAARPPAPPPPSGTDAGTDPGTQPHADGLALLREAVRDGLLVRVDVVGAAGKLERRTLRPLRLDGGRLRAVDPARDAEITVAVHRVARVAALDDGP
ncbi:helicase-associated domain-containing protein [Myceligenerans pegani]|uniref:Helicase-associated domain-containing protein n=1 Tax=Myceligenerans pegani TaxID=2776917 RepID=A0ABR9MVZ4_9MICO|nr:helicase-associated domain-containing protein [Myceligenerans sp. TRM 65318]MBE1875216.1 helicase-associated domain-containing protein [Myceligenerans sp. TRM 65318]MBE3017487.1 helicase-associated domain-containing protein [Myceligenerans sp. TRM 65318]